MRVLWENNVEFRTRYYRRVGWLVVRFCVLWSETVDGGVPDTHWQLSGLETSRFLPVLPNQSVYDVIYTHTCHQTTKLLTLFA